MNITDIHFEAFKCIFGPIFLSRNEFKRTLQSSYVASAGPDDAGFDAEWLVRNSNAWRLAESGLIPFTKTIELGKHDRSVRKLLTQIEPGTLPLRSNDSELPDLHDCLYRIHQAFQPCTSRQQTNVYLELIVRSLLAYAIPTLSALQRIAEFSDGKIVEIGAGRGYWLALLSNLGVDCVGYDLDIYPRDNPWLLKGVKDIVFESEAFGWMCDKLWFPVKEGTYQVLDSLSQARTLLLIWPPKEDSLSSCCLERFTGSRLIYIGEPRGLGCAEDEFFLELWSDWVLSEVIDIPRFPWLEDKVFFYERSSA